MLSSADLLVQSVEGYKLGAMISWQLSKEKEMKPFEMSRHGKYILNDAGEPVLENDVVKWSDWYERAIRTKETKICSTVLDDDVLISTVFLALDHGFGDRTLLWETMVFGGALDSQQERCGGSREQAEAMHAKWVKKAKAEK